MAILIRVDDTGILAIAACDSRDAALEVMTEWCADEGIAVPTENDHNEFRVEGIHRLWFLIEETAVNQFVDVA